MTENAQFQGTHSKLKQTENHVEALESELVMQESIYESRIKEMQRDLDKQIDEIYQNKEKDDDGDDDCDESNEDGVDADARNADVTYGLELKIL